MFSIIKTGGKQYKVEKGTIIKLEKIKKDLGEYIEFKDVLLFQDGEKTHIGSPLVKDVSVTAKIVQQNRHKKVSVIKFRRRKNSMKHQGHRQYYTKVKVTEIHHSRKE